jgi:chromate reductase
VEIAGLPLYNEDLDGAPPAEWTAFRNQIKAADGVIFFTPEYNRTIPGGLKNAIDVASRPYGENVWNGKPAAVVSVTPGGLGAFGANHNLRQALTVLNMPCMQQPEAYISGAHKLVEGDGFDENTTSFLKKFMSAYEAWLSKNI